MNLNSATGTFEFSDTDKFVLSSASHNETP